MDSYEWNWNAFQENNKKLDICLKYGVNDIILISINAKKAADEIALYLKKEYSFSLVDISTQKNSIVDLLKQYGNHQSQLCLFHIDDTENYDIIKTLNISRELLRDIGRVVLLMPQGLVDRVFFDNPNLYDYISITLDYNIHYDCPINPIYSEENRRFIPKRLLSTQKKIFREGERIKNEGIAEYYDYLNSLIYQSLSEKDFSEVDNAFHQILEESAKKIGAQSNNDTEKMERNLKEMLLDIHSETALFFLRKNRFSFAYDLYKKCLGILFDMNTFPTIRLLEAYQGMAYCQYEKGNIKLCTDLLQEMLQIMEPSKNKAWECKIYNDLGACIYLSGNVDMALERWNVIRKQLNEEHLQSLNRFFRNTFNRTLAGLMLHQNPKGYIKDWKKLGELLQATGLNLENFQYLFLDSWLHFYCGENEAAQRIAEKTYQIGLEILPENNVTMEKLRRFRKIIERQM